MTDRSVPQHFRTFDAWRFVAALAVMVFHFSAYDMEGLASLRFLAHRMQQVIDLFFILSGFVIMTAYSDKVRSLSDYRNFLVRRLARIYPLHLLTLGFFVCLALAGLAGLVPVGNWQRYDFSTLPAQLLLVHAWGVMPELTFNYVSWSISAEWMAYLLFPCIALMNRKAGLWGLALAFGLAAMAVEALTQVGFIPEERWIESATYGAFRALPSFVLGCGCAVVVTRYRLPVTSLLPGLVAFVATCLVMLPAPPAYVIMAGFGLAMVLTASAELNNPDCSRIFRHFELMGRASFGIYMLHPVFASFFMALVWEHFLKASGLVNFYLYMAVVGALVIAGAVISMWLIETPLRDLINRRFAPAKSKTPEPRQAVPAMATVEKVQPVDAA